MITIIKTYKSEQSLINQQGYFRAYFNQVRKNKSTKKFTKVKTTKYDSLLQEMWDYKDNEYICAGLNSFEREVLVVDNDDETFGKSTLSDLSKIGLVPHCQKVKPNGHSQTYFFIKPFQIGSAGFINGKYWENDNFENHEKFKRLTKMMNYLFSGDLGYTGYNCQNPLYIDANITSYKPVSQLYTFDDLYNFCLGKMSNVENLDDFLRKMRKLSMVGKKVKDEKEYEIIYKFKDKDNNIQSNQSIITNDTLSDIDVEATIDKAVKEYDKYINERIFILCCQVCKSFYQSGNLNYDHLDIISKTCYNNFIYQDYAKGYSTQELIDRIRADVRQVIYNNIIGKMNWNLVGYTKKQRELSLEVRKEHHNNKLQTIQSIITNDTLSYRKIAEKYQSITGETIGIMTVKRIVDEIKDNNKNNNNNINKDNQSQSIFSIITNDTPYVEKLVDEAIEIQNTKYNRGKQNEKRD